MSHTERTRVLVTGGAGFIGSHTCVELIQAGYEVVVVDNLLAGHLQALERVEQITGVAPAFERVDITDAAALDAVFQKYDIDAIIHFAARKAVGESVEIPLDYFHTNIAGTATLMAAARRAGVTRLVFSSSCSVYGDTEAETLDETSPTAPANPYAWSKLTCEQMIRQACELHDEMRAISLRYFNPIGAHPSGLLGEDPHGIPRNIVPYLSQVASGQREKLSIFGGDYATPDGTAIRDYVHVVDIARGHVAALDHLDDAPTMQLFNLGTGTGTSVLELHAAFEAASGRTVAYEITDRRAGDVTRLVADTGRVESAWGWAAELTLDDMCRDSWGFQLANPSGYA